MKRSIILAAFFAAAASASGAGAFTLGTSPYVGSDTEFNITNQAIHNSGLGNASWNAVTNVNPAYSGGGSGGGEAAMAAGRQQTAPMSRFVQGPAGSNACSAPDASKASGIVIGIDAVRVFGATAAINSATCAGSTGGTSCTVTSSVGLAHDGTNGNGLGFTNWRDAVSLLYGGLDRHAFRCQAGNNASCTGTGDTTSCGTGGACLPVTDCASTKRQQLIQNWGNLFQNSTCTNTLTVLGTCTGASCADGTACTVGSACGDGSTCTAAPASAPYCVVGAPAGGAGSCVTGVCTKYAGLTHAFRRDDISGTSDAFSNLAGFQNASYDPFGNKYAGFKVAPSAVNGFGTSPFCNAMNWDLTEAAKTGTNNVPGGAAVCGTNADLHYIGPGGVPVPTARDATQFHHFPPAGAYGDTPFGTQPSVFPTSFQDNDPLRTPCLGTGVAGKPGEDVCNDDGKLGVVLPIPALDFIAAGNPGLVPYTAGPTTPAAGCGSQTASYNVDCTGGFIGGAAPKVFTCAPRNLGVQGNGLCPNNDKPLSFGCFIPVGPGASTTQCQNGNSNKPNCFNSGAASGTCTLDGRIYNSQVYNGVATNGSGAYLTIAFSEVSPAGADPNVIAPLTPYTNNVVHTGGWGRIHQREVSQAGQGVCQLDDASDNIGCLVQADPNALGYAGNTGDSFEARDHLHQCFPANPTSGIPVAGIGAGASCTPAPVGGGASYPLWRKLYFNSIIGFGAIDTANNIQEQNLAEWEAQAANIGPIMSQYSFFPLPFSPLGSVVSGGNTFFKPFCEDFNEFGNSIGCQASGESTNFDGCAANSAATSATFGAVPTSGTLCGNGTIEAYEDCDPGTSALSIAAAALPSGCGTCSNSCRCSNF